MATALYLETFLENIESLPRDFQRNFALIKDLDNRVQGLEEEIKSLLSSYEKEVKKLSEADRKANLCQIQEKFDKMKEYSDDKVQLAVQMYEMVDKHIRRLDGDLARFEAEIHMKENEKRKESISSMFVLPCLFYLVPLSSVLVVFVLLYEHLFSFLAYSVNNSSQFCS
jgi:chromosome segregation ATPase